jgi:hypothetical protein
MGVKGAVFKAWCIDTGAMFSTESLYFRKLAKCSLAQASGNQTYDVLHTNCVFIHGERMLPGSHRWLTDPVLGSTVFLSKLFHADLRITCNPRHFHRHVRREPNNESPSDPCAKLRTELTSKWFLWRLVAGDQPFPILNNMLVEGRASPYLHAFP